MNLHKNLLLPLQGKFRQEHRLEKVDTLVADAEDDEITELPCVPILPNNII